jgi:hypothetical protein
MICPDLEPWLSQSLDSLTQAQAFDAIGRANGDLTSLDAATALQAAVDVALLVENQRALEAPASASEANRLAITALSTFARGLDVMATAAEDRDPDLLSQGRSIAADGRLLLERAEVDIAGLVDACVETP